MNRCRFELNAPPRSSHRGRGIELFAEQARQQNAQQGESGQRIRSQKFTPDDLRATLCLMLLTMIPHHAHGRDYEIVVDALLSGVRVYSTFNGAQIGPTLSSSFDHAFLDQPLWGVVVDELVKIAIRDLDRGVLYEQGSCST